MHQRKMRNMLGNKISDKIKNEIIKNKTKANDYFKK